MERPKKKGFSVHSALLGVPARPGGVGHPCTACDYIPMEKKVVLSPKSITPVGFGGRVQARGFNPARADAPDGANEIGMGLPRPFLRLRLRESGARND